MKEFNLDEYLKNPNRELITRSGRKVRIICTDRKDVDYPIVVLISNEFGNGESTLYYTEEGKFYTDSTSPLDLFFTPEKKVCWANIYRGKDEPVIGRIFNSEEEARESSRSCNGFTKNLYLGTAKIEWEE